MRRDIIAGCVGLIVTAYIVYVKRNIPIRKPIEYSPFIHKPDIVPGIQPIIMPAAEVPIEAQQSNTYKLPEVEASSIIDELMQLPLESDGFINESAEEDNVDLKTVFVKYIRFQCTEIRNSTRVEIGGFRFLYNSKPIPYSKIQIWNPHTGESSAYSGDAWTDSDQLTIVFCFSEPLEVNQYELRSSSVSMDHDPMYWKLEGSMNGSFWTVLDDRTKIRSSIPHERRAVVKYRMASFRAKAT